jgi:phage N-6-adenine-methyltransferase
MTMPAQRPGQSKQDYRTPPDFLTAVKARLGIREFAIDLAADDANPVAPIYYTETDNALLQSWAHPGWGWCNPPFADLEPWVEKANWEAEHGWAADQRAQVAMLVPASVGSNWWATYVDGQAHVLLLSPRLTFVGCTAPYPKDCALLLYTPYIRGGYECWRWKAS